MKKLTSIIVFCFISAISFSQNAKYKKGLKYFDSMKFIKSFKIMQPYADSGDKTAQFIVGYCYYNKELEIKNDSLAEQYLIKSANQKFGRAMGLLSVIYFQKSITTPKYKVNALVWAEIAAAYDPIQKGTTTRHLIKAYMSSEELQLAKQLLEKKKQTFNKINLEEFKASIPSMRNKKSKRSKIPKNKLGLMEDPYRDWVSRWKYEQFECYTLYYTKSIDASIINATISAIQSTKEFELSSLYRGKQTKNLKLSAKEKSYIIKELSALLNHEWQEHLFPYSSRLDSPQEIQNAFNRTEKLGTEKEKNMCAIVYTFSKPIILRNGTLALFLDQKRYRTNYTQLNFSFYSLENNRWKELAVVYKYYEN
ncbi:MULTISPECIES: hypothetical protein [unclassified Tenacibaculum]|uniref:hypothetical protein n=1 Tax=unclassified Tenacibaculum TaxID=2635139 RepID=UPI001F1DC2D1|nr:MULTISPECIES: hypothetical protein [unclassified Tenacibaculum]MCF2874780.1 hypothetical protein [Tenacibaculum sp. Cn5-1]MCF2934154.1 hypothetical protein [Tenacibaculum sp. Cn5-34]MCG7510364.1 hypothetical protein [Tenacibaculum sp. Cn5-46]